MANLELKYKSENTTIDSSHRTIDDKTDITSLLLEVKEGKKNEIKDLTNEIKEDLGSVKNKAALTAAVKETLENETTIKNSSKEGYKAIAFATDRETYIVDIKEDLVDDMYVKIADTQEELVVERLTTEKENKIKEGKEDTYELTDEEQAEVAQIEKEFDLGKISVSAKTPETKTNTTPKKKGIRDTIKGWFDRSQEDLTEEGAKAKAAKIEEEMSGMMKAVHFFTGGGFITAISSPFKKLFGKKSTKEKTSSSDKKTETTKK